MSAPDRGQDAPDVVEGLDLARVLAEHEWRDWHCSCGVKGVDVPDNGVSTNPEDAHLTAALHAEVAHWLADEEMVALNEIEARMAKTAVRKYLQKLRNNYRNDLRRPGRGHFARTHLRRFDDYLDLFARLGGNTDDVADPEDAALAALTDTQGGSRHG